MNRGNSSKANQAKQRKQIRHQASKEVLKKVLDFLENDEFADKLIAKTDAEEYSKLSLREKDFAMQYAIEFRTYDQWAKVFHVSSPTIYNWSKNPAIRKLIEETKRNILKYHAAMELLIHRESLMQYKRIFDFPETDAAVLEVKLKAAQNILDYNRKCLGMGMMSKEEMQKIQAGALSQSNVNLNVYTGDMTQEQTEDLAADAEIDVDEVLEKAQEIKKLQESKEKVKEMIKDRGIKHLTSRNKEEGEKE